MSKITAALSPEEIAEAKERLLNVVHTTASDAGASLDFLDLLALTVETSMLTPGDDGELIPPPVVIEDTVVEQFRDAMTLMLQHKSSDERWKRPTEMNPTERVERLNLAANAFLAGLQSLNYAMWEVSVMTGRRPSGDPHRSAWEDVTARLSAATMYELVSWFRTILMVGAQAKTEAQVKTSKTAATQAQRAANALNKKVSEAEKEIKKLQAQIAEANKSKDEPSEDDKPKRNGRGRGAKATTSEQETVETPAKEQPAEEADTPKTEPVAEVKVNENSPTQTSGSGNGRGRGSQRGQRAGRSLRAAAGK